MPSGTDARSPAGLRLAVAVVVVLLLATTGRGRGGRRGAVAVRAVGAGMVAGQGALQVRAVAADPDHHVAASVIHEQRDGVDATGVDLTQVVGDHALEATTTGDGVLLGRVATEVERAQEVQRRGVATGDVVEFVLHRGGEVEVHQPREMLLEQPDHGERQERRDQRLVALAHVPAVLDRLHDRGVRRGPPDAQFFQGLDQRSFGVPGRRLGRVAEASRASAVSPWPLTITGSRFSASSASASASSLDST